MAGVDEAGPRTAFRRGNALAPMARFLFVVPPLIGHFNPTVSVARELESRGHHTAWVGHRQVIEGRLPKGAELFGLDTDIAKEELIELTEKARILRAFASVEFLWGEIVPRLARQMIPGVRAAVGAYDPSVMVVDQQAVAGAFVAREKGLRWATFATTSGDRRECLGSFPKVLQWTEDRLAELQRDVGLDPAPEPDASPYLTIVFSTPALVGATERFPPAYRFVGPALSHRPSQVSFPWDELRQTPRVLATLGTVNADRGERFFSALAEALGSLPLQVVVVAPDSLGPFPPNFIARRQIPQLELLPQMNAVVCHAGHNTVCEALAHGLPLVVAPIKDDQPAVAEQVTRSGAGVRVSFSRSRPETLRSSVLSVLREPRYREAALRIRSSFEKAGGAKTAATLLEELAEHA